MSVTKRVLPNDPQHLKNAFKDLGLKQFTGKRHNPRILEMFKKSGHGWVQRDTVAWCAAAVNAWLKDAGLPITSSLAARSYLQWGKETKNPSRGDIVVFWRGSKNSWQGHVAFYLGRVGSRIWVIGGNQSNAVTITSYPASRLLGYRKPVSTFNSRTVGAGAVIGASAATAGGIEMANLLSSTGQEIRDLASSEIITMIALVLILGGAVWTFYARWTDWRDKAR